MKIAEDLKAEIITKAQVSANAEANKFAEEIMKKAEETARLEVEQLEVLRKAAQEEAEKIHQEIIEA